MTYRYLVWHMDGTMFDTLPARSRALCDALHDLGAAAAADNVAALLAQAPHACARIAASHGVAEAPLRDRFERHYRQILLREQMPFAGVVDLCQAAVEGGGHNYVYTERQQADLERFLAAFGMLDLFSGLLTAAESTVNPDPVTLVTAYDLPPQEVLVITNRDHDIWLAHRAGLQTCLFGTRHSLIASYAVTSYDDLLIRIFPSVPAC